MRTVALIVIMAHLGSYVSASEAQIPLTDKVFTRVGATDYILKGQSTFMVEMQETSYILNHATENSLIILDEIGRGRSTYDGLSIAWYILEYIHDIIKAKTIFATHYHELIEVAESLIHAENISVDVRESKGEIIFLYNIRNGGIDKSYGIEVSRLAGLPKKAINRAKQILHRLEKDQLRLNLKNKIPVNQETLFLDNIYEKNAENEKLIDDIKNIEIENLTPLEALNKINELKKNIN
jgi:DNA mismatch repair protein MutS